MRRDTVLSKARRVSLLSQRDMGERFGVSAMSIGNWEREPMKMRLQDVVHWYCQCTDAGKAIMRPWIASFFG